MCSGTTFRHSAAFSKLRFFFDSLQYHFSLNWNTISFCASAHWGVRWLLVGAGERKRGGGRK